MVSAVRHYYRIPFAENLPEDKIIQLFVELEYWKTLEAGNKNKKGETSK